VQVSPKATSWKAILTWGILSAALTAVLEALRLFAGASFSWPGLCTRWAFVVALLLLARWTRPFPTGVASFIWPWPGVLTTAIGAAAALVYAASRPAGWSTEAAWGLLGVLYLLLLGLDHALVGRLGDSPLPPSGAGIVRSRGTVSAPSGVPSGAGRAGVLVPVLKRWGARSLLTIAAGVIPTAIAQIESHFADEEFFVALQALALSLFWLLLLGTRALLARHQNGAFVGTMVRHQNGAFVGTMARHQNGGREPATPGQHPRPGLRMDRRWLSLTLVFLAFSGLCVTVRAYQRSFYSPQAPAYPGISPEAPFLCGSALPDTQTFDGDEVFHRLLTQIAALPDKGPPELGFLALGTGEQRWASAFRHSLLDEAAQGHFAGPAHSVKWGQYEAALRAYYLPRVHAAFPDLFTESDLVLLRQWFADINQRTLTAEWVDWMYALAFARWPEGPYENQENGAGLLALLETEALAAPDLTPANRDYLERNPRGWVARFRNTDDAFIYQPEWITNAYFQSLYTGELPQADVERSFEWLLLQSLPDGAPLQYNHSATPSLASTAYLGARLLEDPNYVWLAGRALADPEAHDAYVLAQPGAEQPVSLTGRSPTQGSCLLYGDSGLPNQAGPLAPDKIIFRDGWLEDSAYLLLNLRFTGWHRYKASNTVTLIYQHGPLAADVIEGEPFGWLPAGRSLLRDKRIPRENLNGLLVERSGMSAVLYTLTGIGGPWAQDPPHYAEVLTFETGDELDWTHTRLSGWRGWQHDRWIYFYHDGGPAVVVDEAEGPSADRAALAWHFVSDEKLEPGAEDTPAALSGETHERNVRRIPLRTGEHPAEALVIPLDPGGRLDAARGESGDSGLRVVYYPSANDRLRVLTVFLMGEWAGAQAALDAEGTALRITQGEAHITLPLPVE
jgi:hypothetical protein